MDSIIHGVTKSRTRLSDFHFQFCKAFWRELKDSAFETTQREYSSSYINTYRWTSNSVPGFQLKAQHPAITSVILWAFVLVWKQWSPTGETLRNHLLSTLRHRTHNEITSGSRSIFSDPISQGRAWRKHKCEKINHQDGCKDAMTFWHACRILVPTRDPTLTPAVGVQGFNHWTTEEVLQWLFF